MKKIVLALLVCSPFLKGAQENSTDADLLLALQTPHEKTVVEKNVCDRCGQSFSTPRSLGTHKAKRIKAFKDGLFPCDHSTCCYYAEQSPLLHAHQLVAHHKKATYSCSCGIPFSRLNSFFSHKHQLHKGEEDAHLVLQCIACSILYEFGSSHTCTAAPLDLLLHAAKPSVTTTCPRCHKTFDSRRKCSVHTRKFKRAQEENSACTVSTCCFKSENPKLKAAHMQKEHGIPTDEEPLKRSRLEKEEEN
jgi:hypothetical protein